jgi:predicted  nucleic acid-binding Zn-ribbon protein
MSPHQITVVAARRESLQWLPSPCVDSTPILAAPLKVSTTLETTNYRGSMLEHLTPPESLNSCSSNDDLEHTPAPTTPPDSPISGILASDKKEVIVSPNVVKRAHQAVCVPSVSQAGNCIGRESAQTEGKRFVRGLPIMNRNGKGIDLHATLMAITASNATVLDELKGLATEVDGLKRAFHAQNETIDGDFKNRRIEMWRLKTSCDTMQKDLAKLKAEFAARKAERAELRHDLDILDRNTSRLENGNKTLRIQINNLETSTAILKSEFAELRREMDRLWVDSAEIQRDSKALRADFDGLNAESAERKRQIKNMMDVYKDLRTFAGDHYANCNTNPSLRNRSGGPQFSLKRKRAAPEQDENLAESTNKRQKALLVG